jgi:hypothetical protein
MQAFYTDHFVLPLPPGHRIMSQKLAHEPVVARGLMRQLD